MDVGNVTVILSGAAGCSISRALCEKWGFPERTATTSTLPSRLSFRQPPSSQLLSRNARQQRFDIKNRRPIQHIHPANMKVTALAPKQFDNSQSNRIRTPRRPRRKHSMRSIVRGRRTQQFEPPRPIELPDNDQMRKTLDIRKPQRKLGQNLKHAIRLVLSPKTLGDLAHVLVRTTHNPNRSRPKHGYPSTSTQPATRWQRAPHFSRSFARSGAFCTMPEPCKRTRISAGPQAFSTAVACDIQPCPRHIIAR